MSEETTPSPATADLGPSPVQLAGDQDEIILSTMDSAPRPTDALSLPPTQAQADALPVPAVPPPPFGTQYEFGADGLILPTPEGIVTPDGLRLVAGAPPKKPPPRPAAIAALAASTSNAPAAETPAETPATAAPAADPRLQGFRPRPRPEGLRAPGADDAALEIPAEKRMASLRPRGGLALFGGSSGPVPPFDPQRLAAGGSLFLTRPTLGHYVATRAELLGRTDALFAAVDAGTLDVRIGARFGLDQAAEAHRALEGRATTGKVLLLP